MSRYLSREGLPASEYRWFHLLLALPGALVFGFLAALLELSVRRRNPVGEDRIPADAIVYSFHPEVYYSVLSWGFWTRVCRGGKILGAHHFISYIWILGSYLRGIQAMRLVPGQRGTLDRIIAYLKSPGSGRFALRTDSGGPYDRVRPTMIKMSIASGRPLVAIRQRASRYFTIRHHQIPYPFAALETRVSEPIPADVLASLSPEDALALAQERIDALGRDWAPEHREVSAAPVGRLSTLSGRYE